MNTSGSARGELSAKVKSLLTGRTRVLLAWGFGIALVLATDGPPRPTGAAICLVGALLRVWASGILRKNQKVALGGPYSWVRNPLYLGTYLMALGCAAAAGAWILLAAASLAFAIVYNSVIGEEEGWLTQVLGPPYTAYRARVPRFWPLRLPLTAAERTSIDPQGDHSFSLALAQKNRALEAIWTFLAMMAGIWLISILKSNF